MAGEGGEGTRDAAEQILENTFLDGTAGDDFIGVQCYERTVLGPTGPIEPAPGTRLTQMGYEYWPQVVEYTVRRAAAYTGLPVLVTENGLATEDDPERIEFITTALAGPAPLHRRRRSTCAGTSSGACSTTSSGTSDSAPSSASARVDPVTFERRPKPSAHWFGAVAQANALTAARRLSPPAGRRPRDGLADRVVPVDRRTIAAREGRPGRGRRRRG